MKEREGKTMNKRQIERCIELTKEIMIRHFQKDEDFVIRLLDKNCIWIGSCANEFYQGKDTIVSVLRQEVKSMPLIELYGMEFMCASHDVNECVITGRYLGQTCLESGEIYRDMQRVTFVWKKTNEELSVVHMHVSNPMQNVDKDDNFPHSIGTYTKEYLDMLLVKDTQQLNTITIKDYRNRHQVIKITEILYCEASNMKCIIHLTSGDVIGRMTLLEFEGLLKNRIAGMFERIHKSYLVNKYQVASLSRFQIILMNGKVIPVSKQRYGAIREWLHNENIEERN